MEENSDIGVETEGGLLSRADRDLIGQIHRELARLEMPCDCKEELDRTIVAIEAWQMLKRRKELIKIVQEDYHHLVSGVSFLTDLENIGQRKLSDQDLRDHAESLKFLADLADRCARRLNELSAITVSD
ncbi:MAG: hypothetical protein AAGA50_19000 [Pseudomonadota bacterium]